MAEPYNITRSVGNRDQIEAHFRACALFAEATRLDKECFIGFLTIIAITSVLISPWIVAGYLLGLLG